MWVFVIGLYLAAPINFLIVFNHGLCVIILGGVNNECGAKNSDVAELAELDECAYALITCFVHRRVNCAFIAGSMIV